MDALLVGPGVGMGADAAADDMEGFKVVTSKKYGRRRRVNREEEEAPVKEDVLCEIAVPWVPLVGDRRKVRKWSQARKGGTIMTKEGPGYFSYGTYGPWGLEF